MASAIRSIVRLRAPAAADDVRILYGGSVVPGNAARFVEHPDVDGLLVGGASLGAEEFLSIVGAC
jgi:triosephosphate isomerase